MDEASTNKPGDPMAGTVATEKPSMFGKLGTVAFGFFLMLMGLVLLDPAQYTQSATQVGLGSVVTAFGMGIIATVFLPRSIEVGGERFKPLGLDVKASGGAAVFIVVLAFLYFTNTPTPAGAEPAPVAENGAFNGGEPVAIAGGGEAQVPAVTANPAGAQTAAPQNQAISQPAAPNLAKGMASPAQPALPNQLASEISQATLEPGIHLAWTYCSTCCPQGPDLCPHASWGMALDAQQAADTAILYCAQSGGTEQSCRQNVVFATAADLGL